MATDSNPSPAFRKCLFCVRLVDEVPEGAFEGQGFGGEGAAAF